jgi:anti-sigma B factor antagonist
MQLFRRTQKWGNVALIRCRGRLVTGDEALTIQLELKNLSPAAQQIVLQLAEVEFIDSGGLGALIRILGALKSTGGDLRVCEGSPFVIQVLQATNLDRLFPLYASERAAIGARSARQPHPEGSSRSPRPRVVCIDTSRYLLAYLRALLLRAGYDVFATRRPSDASIFIKVTKPRAVILGPGKQGNPPDFEDFHGSAGNIPLLALSSDFVVTEASQAGVDLVNRIRSMLSAE